MRWRQKMGLSLVLLLVVSFLIFIASAPSLILEFENDALEAELAERTAEVDLARRTAEAAQIRERNEPQINTSDARSNAEVYLGGSANTSANSQVLDTAPPSLIDPSPRMEANTEELSNVYCSQAKEVLASNVFELSVQNFNASYQLTCSNIQEAISYVSAYGINRDIVRITAQFRLRSNQNEQITRLYDTSWATTKTSYSGLVSSDATAGIVRDLAERIKLDRHLFLGN